MKRVLLLITGIITMLSVAGVSSALTIDSSYGNWTGTNGGYNVNIDNISDPATVLWGQGWDGNQTTDLQSGLGFSGTGSTTFNTDTAFQLGTLFHYNNPIWAGSEATEAYLDVYLDFSIPDLDPMAFSFTFEVEETANDPDPVDDIITFPTSFATESFEYQGVRYTLELLGFGDSADDLISQFSSEEGGVRSTDLWARITESPVPEPATLLLFGMGLLGLAGAGRKK